MNQTGIMNAIKYNFTENPIQEKTCKFDPTKSAN
jgi:hypothetical protein